MGNSESEPAVHQPAASRSSPSREENLCVAPINKNTFLDRIDPSISNLGQCLWNKYAEADVLEPQRYRDLIHDLSVRSDKLIYLIDLIDATELTQDDISTVISWLSFGHNLEGDFKKAAFKPLLSLNCPVEKKEVYSRLQASFSDFAEDLTRILHVSITGGTPLPTSFELATGFNDLLNQDMLWVLALLLSSPYKRPNPSRLGNIAPLEMEQLAHLHCLFNSKKHGFSITRIKELAFDYDGPLLILLKAEQYLFCLASDQGLQDSFNPYGAENSRLLQILPEIVKLVSGRFSKQAGPGDKAGIIYSNFTSKTCRRGLLVGHQPLVSPAIEVDEGFTTLQFAGSSRMKLAAVEIWAAGPPSQINKLTDQKAWELQQVIKEKNRKIKLDEDWRESADRHLLTLAGVNVNHSEVTPPEHD